MKEIIVNAEERSAKGFQELIRCKDCINGDITSNEVMINCVTWDAWVTPDDFCSYAEKR